MNNVQVSGPQAARPNDPCWCGSGQKYKKCHKNIDEVEARKQTAALGTKAIKPGTISPMRTVPPEIPRPDYAESGRPSSAEMPEVMGPEEIARLRRACKAAAEVLHETSLAIRPGITTDEIDAICHQAYLKRGGYPSTLNYHHYPKSLCTSVNEIICHGIPDDRQLENGDIVNLDVTIFLEGMHGDLNATYLVGEVDEESKRLVKVTRECLEHGIAAVKPGLPINVIGRAIEQHATAHGFSVVRAYCGHGIGSKFHSGLQIPHFYDPEATLIMKPGMTFTIEPMINAGGWGHRVWKDGWTAVTADGKRSAQFEHTLLVTETGAEVLTA